MANKIPCRWKRKPRFPTYGRALAPWSSEQYADPKATEQRAAPPPRAEKTQNKSRQVRSEAWTRSLRQPPQSPLSLSPSPPLPSPPLASSLHISPPNSTPPFCCCLRYGSPLAPSSSPVALSLAPTPRRSSPPARSGAQPARPEAAPADHSTRIASALRRIRGQRSAGGGSESRGGGLPRDSGRRRSRAWSSCPGFVHIPVIRASLSRAPISLPFPRADKVPSSF